MLSAWFSGAFLDLRFVRLHSGHTPPRLLSPRSHSHLARAIREACDSRHFPPAPGALEPTHPCPQTPSPPVPCTSIHPPSLCAAIHLCSLDRQGGANGSIRFEPEINHGANAGLTTALQLLKPLKKKFEEVGWADLMQLASATAVEVAGERTGRRTEIKRMHQNRIFQSFFKPFFFTAVSRIRKYVYSRTSTGWCLAFVFFSMWFAFSSGRINMKMHIQI